MTNADDGSLVKSNVDGFSIHGNGALEADVHNLYGLGEEKATFNALLEINKGERPFIISRSTWAGAGKWTGHWVSSVSPWRAVSSSIHSSVTTMATGGRCGPASRACCSLTCSKSPWSAPTHAATVSMPS